MALGYEDIKDIIETVALNHKEVKSFDFGDSWESSVGGDGIESYPKVYFETPILGSINRTRKTFSFGLVVFTYPDEVYVRENHFENISDAATIMDEIIAKISKDYNTLSITYPYSTTSFTLNTTSMLDGVRADLEITVTSSCDIDDKFN